MSKFISMFAEDLENMIALKVATNHTESTYLPRAGIFDRFCAENFPTESIVTETLALEWIHDALLNNNRNGAHSRLAFLRTLAEYQKALGKNAYVPPRRMVTGGSIFVPYIFSEQELSDLFREIDCYRGSDHFQGILMSVYFRLTYTCGLRPIEGRMLKRPDVDLNSGEIRIIHTKWNKSRSVIMSDSMCAVARKYALLRDAAFPDSDWFFPSKNGGPYTAAQMQTRFRKCFENVHKDIAPELLPAVRVYDLRHRFATEVLQKWLDQQMDLGARLPYLQMYMGHKELASTAYYIHLLPERLVRSKGINWDQLKTIIPEVEPWEE